MRPTRYNDAVEPTSFDLERFGLKVSPQTNGCWLWIGGKQGNGYGNYGAGGKQYTVHRFLYEVVRGPVPRGLELDHLCRQRNCVRPSHLEAVTPTENKLRGMGVGGINHRKTHCQNGHPLVPQKSKPHHRFCPICANERHREWRRQLRLAGKKVV